jgi:hypothetical protein
MKVCVASRGSPDYLIDIVCDGLIRLLGRQNVHMEYTQKAQWGGQYAILMQGIETPNTFSVNDAELLVASDRSIPDVEEWTRKRGKNTVALIDGEDYPTLSYSPEKVKVYFKREYLSDARHAANVIPLPFGAIPENFPSPSLEHVHPVCFLYHETHPLRREIADTLRAMGHTPSTERIPKKEYNKRLMSSLVGISVRGCGWDTYRYWETAYSGRVLLSQRLGIRIPDNFLDANEAVFFDGISDFKYKLEGLLGDPNRASLIGQAGRKACLERHMSTHRAKTVLEALA